MISQYKTESRENRKGVVLVGVLALMALLIGVMMEFSYRSKVQLDVAKHRLDAHRVNKAAESGVDLTKALLSRAVDMDAPELEGLFDEGEVLSFGEIEVEVRLEPECAKINLNRLGEDGAEGEGNRYLLFQLADVLNREYDETVFTYDMVLSIIEWVSAEGAVEFGELPGEPAGTDYYLEKSPPYECKHNPLNAVSELLLVKGITEEVLYGRETEEGEEVVPGIAEFVTIFGGSERIRERLLRDEVTLDDIRDLGPESLRREQDFTIDVRARSGNTTRRIRSVVRKRGPRVEELSRF